MTDEAKRTTRSGTRWALTHFTTDATSSPGQLYRAPLSLRCISGQKGYTLREKKLQQRMNTNFKIILPAVIELWVLGHMLTQHVVLDSHEHIANGPWVTWSLSMKTATAKQTVCLKLVTSLKALDNLWDSQSDFKNCCKDDHIWQKITFKENGTLRSSPL